MSNFPKLPRLKVDDENMEKLHAAARRGDVDEIRHLIASGIDPNIVNRFGCTALHLACKFGQVDAAKYLAEISDVQTPWHGQKPLHLAVLSNKLDLVTALIEGAQKREWPLENMLNECDEMDITQIGEHFKKTKSQSALHWCVGLGKDYLPMLEHLISFGASATTRDKEGETVLMRAMEFNNDAAMQIMMTRVPRNSLRIEVIDHSGRTHLHWACITNHEEYGLEFVERGLDVNVEDQNHIVPLYLAIQGAMLRLTEVLIEKGDSFWIQNAPFHNGRTVMLDRIEWLPFVKPEDEADPKQNLAIEERKEEVLALFQKRLDELLVTQDSQTNVSTKRKKGKPVIKKMQLAPSAPYRSRSRSRVNEIRKPINRGL
ncbi:unnamed protein product [Phytomonas sp. Hart1]|nr:unnamed protein product [Phytomonas sp. Hart1]|eukprot:CCW67391.1 unnamed protein product [Phytomonas sp. isolate Hart1]